MNLHFPNSHSTMYLLKPVTLVHTIDGGKFTFHHVSIKTTSVPIFLNVVTTFTFHHVSIKTDFIISHLKFHFYSHSTMYLLKPSTACFIAVTSARFTFHHVSIKTHTISLTGYVIIIIHIPPCIY